MQCWDWYSKAKKFLFYLDPEQAHDLTLKMASHFPPAAKIMGGINKTEFKGNKYQIQAQGSLKEHFKWRFPVGLAAGLDKNACALDFWNSLGFGAVEIGTVTPKPQAGNPKPRLFRIPEEYSLRNQMGFNNDGLEVVLKSLQKWVQKRQGHALCLGANLGKNKLTPNDQALRDYEVLAEATAPLADYLTVNLSSPNTKGLRDLQEAGFLKELFALLEGLKLERPILLKIAPDLSDREITQIVDLVKQHFGKGIHGLICTNTTIMEQYGAGGVSGRLLLEKSKKVREQVLKETQDMKELIVIGVGGFSSFEDVLNFWQAGGRFVQVYTAFIYQGPKLLRDIRDGMDHLLNREKCQSLEELLEGLYSKKAVKVP